MEMIFAEHTISYKSEFQKMMLLDMMKLQFNYPNAIGTQEIRNDRQRRASEMTCINVSMHMNIIIIFSTRIFGTESLWASASQYTAHENALRKLHVRENEYEALLIQRKNHQSQ